MFEATLVTLTYSHKEVALSVPALSTLSTTKYQGATILEASATSIEVATSVIPLDSVVLIFSSTEGFGIPAGILVSSFHKKRRHFWRQLVLNF